MDARIGEPEEPQPQLATALFAKVVLATLAGEPAVEFLDRQRARHLAAMTVLIRARRAATTTHDALLTDYQLFHLEADVRWIDNTVSRLTTLAQVISDGSTAGRV